MNTQILQSVGRSLLCLVTIFTALPSAGDTGVFTGNGQSLRQITSKSIQLVSIDVTIALGRGPFLFDGTVPGMDRAEYQCKFVLRNLTEKAEDVQVGFPIDSEFARDSEKETEETKQNWVLDYGFMALDEKTTYHVQFVRRKPGKGPNEYSAIFIWNMSFAPHETKTLLVQYRIPITMGLGSTDRDQDVSKDAQSSAFTQELMTIAQIEQVGYITATGSSWARKVESGTFRIYNGAFENYLNRRGFFEGNVDEKSEEGARYAENFPVHNPWWFKEIKPEGWKPIEGGVQWRYQDFKPKDPITLTYFITQLPKRADEVNAFVDSFVKRIPPQESVRGELEKLRQVLLATYGKEPDDPAVRAFASEQQWYAPRKDFLVSSLNPEQKAVLESLSNRIAAAN